MTNALAPASEVLRGIEVISALSNGKVAEALRSLEDAQRADATATETAVNGLGAAYAKTVMDLARMTAAPARLETLLAIRSLVDTLIAVEQDIPAQTAITHPSATVSVPSTDRSEHVERPLSRRVLAGPQVSDTVRIDMFGISVLASRKDEADMVIADARSALAQNKKTNPYESYRGKNSWLKTLYVAAYTHLASIAATVVDPPQVDDAAKANAARNFDFAEEDFIEPSVVAVATHIPPAQALSDVTSGDTASAQLSRPSLAKSGPLRSGSKPQSVQEPGSRAAAPAEVTHKGRMHGLGAAVQTIDMSETSDAVKAASRTSPASPRQPFFRKR